jgi:hypothetical protein
VVDCQSFVSPLILPVRPQLTCVPLPPEARARGLCHFHAARAGKCGRRHPVSSVRPC